MTWKTINQAKLQGKRVLVRVDLNVPIDGKQVRDDTRIRRLRPTIRAIQEAAGLPILASHLGRPNGKFISDLSLQAIIPSIETSLHQQVTFIRDWRTPSAQEIIKATARDSVILLENLRFYYEEEQNDPKFAAELARLADIFCNDAFSCSHRAHASTTGVAKHLPAFAGLLMQKELNALEVTLNKPKRPAVAIVGGSKISTKITLLLNLVNKVDYLVIGGAMANTFLAARDNAVGISLAEFDRLSTAQDILRHADEVNCQVILPTDIVIAAECKPNAAWQVASFQNCPDDKMILDVGPETVAQICEILIAAKTLLWNGPIGAFEVPPFDRATTRLAQFIAEFTRAGELVSVAGGGDTIAALNHANVMNDLTFVSTAGGAFLEWLEGKSLPGVLALNQ
ncbi:MAG: phosphoglycerate kinase [Aestuariivita sp.]|nr:phosphoglycerate kinase [Aestuariivita sp.]MCY4201038.1 phosphoglycerate kinase [Aestuariivita sp.]